MTQGNAPILTVRSGKISVSAWENTHEGRTFHSYKLQKRFKEPATDQWRSTESLSGFDLPVAARLLEKIHDVLEVSLKAQEQTVEASPSSSDDVPY